MLTSVHLLSGAAIGKLTGNLWVAALVGYLLHHILDSIPHYNPKPLEDYSAGQSNKAPKKRLLIYSIEPVSAILVAHYFVFQSPIELRAPVYIGAVFSWLPDLFVFINWKFKTRFVKTRFIRISVAVEKKFHKHTTFWRGIWAQILIVAISIITIIK